MKRFIIALTAIAVVLGFTSCEKQAAKAIVGTWEATSIEISAQGMNIEMDIAEYGVGMTFTFRDNGSGTLTESAEGESISFDFNYSVEGDTLIMEAEGDVAEIPVTIEKKNMTMVMNGDLLEEPGMELTIHFVKK